jgi:hypothetical protein
MLVLKEIIIRYITKLVEKWTLHIQKTPFLVTCDLLFLCWVSYCNRDAYFVEDQPMNIQAMFGFNRTSGFREEKDWSVKNLQRKRTHNDGRKTRKRTHKDGRKVITITHMALWVNWAKGFVIFHICLTLQLNPCKS